MSNDEPIATAEPTMPKGLVLKLRVAFAILLFERLWPAAWPAVSVMLFYIGFSLFDPWFYLPFWVQPIVLIGVIGVCWVLLRRAVRHINLPSLSQARRRMETGLKANSAPGRPLDAMQDAPIKGTSAVGYALWRAQQHRVWDILAHLRLSLPRAGLQYEDPLGIRLIVLFLFLFGLYAAGNSWDNRITSALRFHWSDGGRFANIDAWISPPGYTRKPDQILASAATLQGLRQHPPAMSILAPTGSTVHFRISNITRAPRAINGDQQVTLTERAGGTFSGELGLTEAGKMTLDMGGGTRLRWTLGLVPDDAPHIEFAQIPTATSRHSLAVKYTWTDDYGLEHATLTLRRPGVDDPAQSFELAPAKGKAASSGAKYLDLTPHPWAGSTVLAHLVAVDEGGNQGRSEQLQFILPEREFTHPVARTLISIRKSLFVSPENTVSARRRLELVTKRPEDFDNDLVIYATLQAAYWRLGLVGQQEVQSVTDILWKAALSLEEGGLGQSEENLRQSMDALMQALESGLDGSEIEALTQQLARAMVDMLRDAMQANSPQNQSLPGADGMTVEAGSISEMINQIRELAAAGQTDEAMELLAQLQAMMENLNVQNNSAEDYEKVMEGSRAMNALDSIGREQSRLNQQTQRQDVFNQLMGPDFSKSSGKMDEIGAMQSDLGDALGEVATILRAQGFNGTKELGLAGRAMQEAAQALNNDEAAQAIESQERALENIQTAQEILGDQISQTINRMQAAGNGLDPLGRAGASTGAGVRVPEESELAKAREILEELRARLNDPNRDPIEREYLKRLLERFRGS